MKKSVFEIYCYVVCLLSLMCGITVLGFFSYNIVRVSKPDFTVNERRIDNKSPNEIEKEISYEKKRGLRNLVWQGIILFIDTVVFIIHWIMGRRMRLSKETA